MKALEIIFWISSFIIFYSYLGYGILLFAIIKLRRLLGITKPFTGNDDYEPEVTLFVAAYNEKDYVDEKVKNSFSLNYPQEKVKQVDRMMALPTFFENTKVWKFIMRMRGEEKSGR